MDAQSHAPVMSSPLAVKRRKLNDATKKLTKPFVSPMRAQKADERAPLGEDPNTNNAVPPAYRPSTLAHTITATGSLHHSTPVKSSLTNTGFPANRSTPIRKQSAFASSVKKSADPAELAAQREISALERQIRQVTSELDALKQAKQISTSTSDADLEAVTEKWRTASQEVVEELFGSVKERVYRMGGVAAWRESEKRKFERQNGLGEFTQNDEPVDDDADCEFDEEGEELPEDEQEYRKKMKRQAKREMMEAAEVPDPGEIEEPQGQQKPKVWTDGGKDDDSFTIDMMLQSLNIPLSVIGYDKEQQRWV